MKKTLIASGLTALSALTLTTLPAAANAATSVPQATTVSAASGTPSSEFDEAVNSNLTLVGGRVEGVSELHAINETTFGTSKSPTQFTQDDGWNQEWQEWTGGNELKFGWDAGDEEFTIANLSFGGGNVRGTMFGPHRDMWGPGLEQVNLAGDRKGTPPAKVTVKGSDVAISGQTMDGYQFVLEFTLTDSSNRPLG